LEAILNLTATAPSELGGASYTKLKQRARENEILKPEQLKL